MPEPSDAFLPDLDYARMTGIPVPCDVSNEIVPGLHQGGLLRGDNAVEFDRVLTLAVGYPTLPHELWQDWTDGPDVPDVAAALAIVRTWRADRWRVLVRCEAGLNRSGLVIASVLIAEGWSVEGAIQQVRRQRSPWALCNSTFLAHLRALPADSGPSVIGEEQ